MAERRVRLGLLLTEIGRANNIDVSEEDTRNAVMEEARRYPGQEQMVFEYCKRMQVMQQRPAQFLKIRQSISSWRWPTLPRLRQMLRRSTQRPMNQRQLKKTDKKLAKKSTKKAPAQKSTKKAPVKKACKKLQQKRLLQKGRKENGKVG